MKRIIAITAILAVLVSAAPKCNFGKAVAAFEKLVGNSDIMKGRELRIENYTNDKNLTTVSRISRKIESSGRMGQFMEESVTFKGCVPWTAHLTLYHPKDENALINPADKVAESTLYFRDDGSLQARCEGGGYITVENKWSGLLEPNRNCECFDSKQNKRAFGEYGCLEGGELEYVKSKNAEMKKNK